ncbi:MAG: SBBP repeat-containing protein [Chitinophagaceae bacterium]
MPFQASLVFTENAGQVADMEGRLRPDILFTAHSGETNVFITGNGIYYQFTHLDFANQKETESTTVSACNRATAAATFQFALKLESANPHPVIKKEIKSDYTENFYLAHCPSGITGVSTYSRIVLEEVYPGIDWVIYTLPAGSASSEGMKYDFIVHPGADPSAIKLKIENASDVSITPEGTLLMQTPLGQIREEAPQSFLGNGQPVLTHFKQEDGAIVFSIAPYDHSQTLRIDPRVSWATYYAGGSYSNAQGCAVDKQGNAYLTGITAASSGIASGGFQNNYGGGTGTFPSDAYLVKFSSTGARLWGTYYGGTDNDNPMACATDTNGAVFLTGTTTSTSGIASGGFQNTLSGQGDAFLAKFSSTGTREWATYYGGPGSDNGNGLATDKAGNVYLAGNTNSDVNIGSGGFQNTYVDNTDAFLVKFSPTGARLWGTYYGASQYESGNACATNAAGTEVYLAGQTYSSDSIASGGHQNTFGGFRDAFLVKFTSAGLRVWGTYYGSAGDENGNSCAVDSANNIYLAGATTSTTGIAAGGHQVTFGGGKDAFLVKFNSAGTRLWGTYYGGAAVEDGYSCAVDAPGNVFLTGYTYSSTGIASGGFQNSYISASSNTDAYLVKFSKTGTRLWGTYYGGKGYDYSTSCAVDKSGDVFIAGRTNSDTGIASSGGFLNTYPGGFAGFLAKITETALPNGISNTAYPAMDIRIYPNPNSGEFTIAGKSDDLLPGELVYLEVLNTIGQSVYKTSFITGNSVWTREISLDSRLPNDIYLLRVDMGEKQATLRFRMNR